MNDRSFWAGLPLDLPLKHPACLISTWFGVGLIPFAPGTWGSLAALPFAWVIQNLAGPYALLGASALIFALGWWASTVFISHSDVADPQVIVVDEVAGQWLVLAVAPTTFWYYAAGLVLFRIFDVRKPWPVRWADRSLKGGLGVMLDDILAGGYGVVLLFVLVLVTGGGHVFG